jgi:hypothetical protein
MRMLCLMRRRFNEETRDWRPVEVVWALDSKQGREGLERLADIGNARVGINSHWIEARYAGEASFPFGTDAEAYWRLEELREGLA